MRLDVCLLRFTRFFPRGAAFRGKYRLVKQVTPQALVEKRLEFDRELNNMKLLRFPYLTQEESSGHSRALGLNRKRMRDLTDQYRLKFKQSRTIADRLSHLRVSEAWD